MQHVRAAAGTLLMAAAASVLLVLLRRRRAHRLLNVEDHTRKVIPKLYAAFVSHYKAEAAMEARYLQSELEQASERAC